VALPGALELLNHLTESHIPWGIVTSGSIPVAHARHRAAGLPMPDVFVTAEQVKRGKPEPDRTCLGQNCWVCRRKSVWWWKTQGPVCFLALQRTAM
jgi:hypothetical protein